MIRDNKYIVACNGIKVKETEGEANYLYLEHDATKEGWNTRIELENFVTSAYKVSDRAKDLLEIAGYIFAADRKSSRGAIDAVEMHSWSRAFEIHIQVRDITFWEQPKIKTMLNDALSYMTGDKRYDFVFYKANGDFPTSIFDNKEFSIEPSDKLEVVLYSGGLDSLSGIVELLETTDKELCLMSHQSGNPSVANTQNSLFKEIDKLYPGRCTHYKYYCGLCRKRSVDETQRTRSFLFNSIAFALATTYGINENILFENGVTSFNFAETQDMMNSRASRTTHPKTLGLLMELFSEINDAEYKVENRFYNKTKTDVVNILNKYNKLDLVDISVSCSVSMLQRTSHTHCGICSQCIDRRFAAYSAEVERYDENGLYEFDFVKDDLENSIQKKALSDYIRMAKKYAEHSIDGFYDEFLDEIVDIEEYLGGKSDVERVKTIYDICFRHGKQVEKALDRMREKNDRTFTSFNPNSLYGLILGMRNDSNIIELVQIKQNGETKQEIPHGELTTIVVRIYEKILGEGIIENSFEETKKNNAISKIIIT
ncbi:MAG: hypothetical protein PF445_06625, partial [Melioribacteraceae bacterium]|nr:hypothetical protein [Melioribacteraceae bacterium]